MIVKRNIQARNGNDSLLRLNTSVNFLLFILC